MSREKGNFMNFGVICELNPFHKGHKYLFDNARESEQDGLICVMSGNFTQRGDLAVYDKYERARTAVENGADLVIEIPTLSSTQSAQGFAKAGVKLLESTGICDKIVFGAECDDLEALKQISREIKERDSEIKAELEKGISYPAARSNVIDSPILQTPNNILAIEYLTYTSLDAKAVKRIGKGHDTDDAQYSASEIRKHLSLDEAASLKNCEKAVLYKLRTMSAKDFSNIEDVSEGLENRIAEAVKDALTVDELYDKIKTKRYTHARIRRIILRAYLGITRDMEKSPQYLHILAFNEKGRTMLAEMKKTAVLPIITKYGNIESKAVKELFDLECRFTDIYNLAFKQAKPCGEDQKRRVEIL